MFACKDIFANKSITQVCRMHKGKPKGLHGKTFCVIIPLYTAKRMKYMSFLKIKIDRRNRGGQIL